MRHPSFHIFLAHFVDDLYEGLVCCLMVLDLIEFQHLPHIAVEQRCAIVTNDPIGYPKPDNYVPLMKFATAPPVTL